MLELLGHIRVKGIQKLTNCNYINVNELKMCVGLYGRSRLVEVAVIALM